MKRSGLYFKLLFVYLLQSMIFLIACFLSLSSLSAYQGQESVEAVFTCFEDLNAPTKEELLHLQEFLEIGDRPYITPLNHSGRRNCKGLKFVGESGEAPYREVFVLNTSFKDKKRCIYLYGSYNYPYPDKIRSVVEELKACGYKGHLIVRIGGYPNMQNGGIKLSHIPYAWKITALQEMRELGYEEILWLDASMHPLVDLSYLFTLVRRKGVFLTSAGFCLDYPYSLGEHFLSAIDALHLKEKNLKEIPHIVGGVLGFYLPDIKAQKFLDQFMEETLKVMPCINPYPDELLLSTLAWRNNIKPVVNFSEITFTSKSYNKALKNKKFFYLDENRQLDPLWDKNKIQ